MSPFPRAPTVTMTATPRANGRPPGPDLFDLEAVTADASPYPDRVCVYGPPKWGKSAWAAFSPDPVFLMTKGEDGFLTLKKSGLVPAAARCFPRCASTWDELLRGLAATIRLRPGTLVLDTLNGAEALCHAHVCRTIYGGDWGEKGFSSYQVGYRTTGPQEFQRLLDGIDLLREAGTQVICLAHTAVKTRKNPHGPDYDIMRPALHEATWDLAARRFDVLLCGTFEIAITPGRSKTARAKASGGDRRVLLARPGAAHEAGGRYNLPEEIDCGTSAQEAWDNFQAALNPVPEPEPVPATPTQE